MPDEEKKILKIGFAASTGGHFEQLMMLKPMMDRHNSFIVTEKTAYTAAPDNIRVYYLKQVNRKELLFIPKMLNNIFRSMKILRRENPDAIICTGVLAMIPLCIMAKKKKKKLIYIESFAKVTSPTLSGKLLYKYADQFYVQWEQMLNVFPNAIYKGGIY